MSIFRARRVILDMCLFTIIHEKGAGNWNSQFHAQIEKIIANKTPPGALHLCFAVSERDSEIPSIRIASCCFDCSDDI